MNKFIQSLSRTDQPILPYVFKAALISLIPSIVISLLVSLALPHSGRKVNGSVVAMAVGMVLFSPIFETLLMVPILWILKLFARKKRSIAILSAVVWAVLHSLLAPAWGLTVAWAFFVLTICFLEWEKKSLGKAILVTALVHACHNLFPAIMLLAIS